MVADFGGAAAECADVKAGKNIPHWTLGETFLWWVIIVLFGALLYAIIHVGLALLKLL